MNRTESIAETDRRSDFRFLMILVLIAFVLQGLFWIINYYAFAVFSMFCCALFAYIYLSRRLSVTIFVLTSVIGAYLRNGFRASMMILMIALCISGLMIAYRLQQKNDDSTRRG